VRLFCHHLLIVNNLDSFKKEKRAYESGKAQHLINSVDVIQRLLALPNEDTAIAMSLALQLQHEYQIDMEVKRLAADGALSDKEWKFVDALLACLAGNVLICSIMSRYGGEKARF
jgi:hypothetical protein